MINIKNLDLNKIKIDEKSYTNIFIYYICYVTANSVKPLYPIINKVNGCIDGSNGHQYFTPAPPDEAKDTLKNYQELWSKIKDLIRSITNNCSNCDEKYMKIKFNSDDELPEKQNKTLKL